MRRQKLKAKEEVTVAIPSDFVVFLTDVNELIVIKDECAMLESDDLLQCESAYGGLMKEGGPDYSFTFFPEEGIRVKWEVVLDKNAIENVAKKRLRNLRLWKCLDPACRCAFSNDTESCFYCDWEGGPDQ